MKVILIMLASLSVLGCAVTMDNDNTASYSGLSYDSYSSRVDGVAVFYEGVDVQYEYRQIGLVEAQGNRHADSQVVLSHLKMKALKAGADAIINVKRVYNQRTERTIMSDRDDERSYSSVTYQGVAIRFEDIDALPEHIKQTLNTRDYVAQNQVWRDNQRYESQSSYEWWLSILIGAAYLISL